jgi:hypothetical protein
MTDTFATSLDENLSAPTVFHSLSVSRLFGCLGISGFSASRVTRRARLPVLSITGCDHLSMSDKVNIVANSHLHEDDMIYLMDA